MNIYKHLINIFSRPKSLEKAARRAGYVNDQLGIKQRYLRESNNWESHLNNTKQFIIDAAQKSLSKSSIAILGSGWLHDVPIDELSQMFNSVHLIDIVHPEPIVARVQKMTNVYLQTADLTIGAVQQAANAKTFDSFCNALNNQEINTNFDKYDMVVSVNLLNQLDIILCDFLAEKFKVSEEVLKPIRKTIQQRHLNYLPQGKSCLITDYLQIDTSPDQSTKTEKKLIYCDLPKSLFSKEWNWLFDTKQRYSVKNNTTFKVIALCF